MSLLYRSPYNILGNNTFLKLATIFFNEVHHNSNLRGITACLVNHKQLKNYLVNTQIHKDIYIHICVCIYIPSYSYLNLLQRFNKRVRQIPFLSTILDWSSVKSSLVSIYWNSIRGTAVGILIPSVSVLVLSSSSQTGDATQVEKALSAPCGTTFPSVGHTWSHTPTLDRCPCLRATAAGGCNNHRSLRNSWSEALLLAFPYAAV